MPSWRHSSAIGSSPRSPARTMRLWTPPVMQEIFGTARCMWSGAVVYPAFWCGLQSPLACMEIRGSGPNRIYGLQSALALCWFSPSRLVDRLPLPVLRPSHIPDGSRRDRNPIRQRPAQERGNSPCSSSAPKRCAPSCWPEPPRQASSACAPAVWPARGPPSRRVGPLSGRQPWRQ